MTHKGGAVEPPGWILISTLRGWKVLDRTIKGFSFRAFHGGLGWTLLRMVLGITLYSELQLELS